MRDLIKTAVCTVLVVVCFLVIVEGLAFLADAGIRH